MKVETKTWEVEVNEETLNALYAAYSAATKSLIHAIGTTAEQETLNAKLALENALVALGMLEDDPEPEEEPEDDEDCLDERLDGSTNWDELEADRRFDMYRDMALMGYEY